MLRTRFTERFGLRYPIASAPMGGQHSAGRLAAAVSEAGGLGTFGGIQAGGPEWIRNQIEAIRNRTGRVFGVGFITAFLTPPLFEVCVEERVPLVVLSFGDPAQWVKRAQREGIRTICQVQTLEGLRQAVGLGVDAVVVQGNEAGGHTGYMTTLPLVSMAADIVGDVPLVAAGGIGNGRSLAAVLAAGADGALLGTPFLATPECDSIAEEKKRFIVESDGQNTVHTQAFDILSGAPWPEGIGGRARANRFTREWEGRERELRAQRELVVAQAQEAGRIGDPDYDSVWMGQSAGMVPAIRPAAEVVRSICDEAERILRERPGQVLG